MKIDGRKVHIFQIFQLTIFLYSYSPSGIFLTRNGREFDSQGTCYYYSLLWSRRITFNLGGGKTGFDTQETKLPQPTGTHRSPKSASE